MDTVSSVSRYIMQPDSLDTLQKKKETIVTSVALYKISTVFPFRVFPTVITVDHQKVDISTSVFFGSREINSILIDDIGSVVVDTSPFFATMTIHDRLPTREKITVEYLPKDKALKMRRIIEGLIISHKTNTNLQNQPPSAAAARLESMGKIKPVA
ncbi:hypothetical protein C5B42_02095 [Candidatus Cerribacteria bacterium 'Amazon FNV 2010 28 9']|uniref:YokE-like PH domain-containing protein n=1 Tax=Candidatus Cerribacteria bacterium 'Amazon FNV 2010 28 9' TaxID=2081795 RepID=A0A317JQL2_9BACT|nr:MAG: hypothetical protein C5B42_02095 [Candidatus Cerribacteria bacterium 'Amazon FNV 2010 28 9']